MSAALDILLIADHDRQVADALLRAKPNARIVRSTDWFDAIAKLHDQRYTAVIGPVHSIQQRPRPALAAIRELAPDASLFLYADPSLETTARALTQPDASASPASHTPSNRPSNRLNERPIPSPNEDSCDDYFITPADPAELTLLFDQRTNAPATPTSAANHAPPTHADAFATALNAIANESLVCLLDHPEAPLSKLVDRIRPLLPADTHLTFVAPARTKPVGSPLNSDPHPHAISNDRRIQRPLLDAEGHPLGTLVLESPALESTSDSDGRSLASLRNFFDAAHRQFEITARLSARHQRLQQAVITDDLTGLANGRYFRHFLSRILTRAREGKFLVTLLLFDIDNFKRYNDEFGHGAGDEILKQTASLMKRCCRDHDLVARIAGDEFAVVFWEKEGPRVPRSSSEGAPSQRTSPSRIPQTPLVIAQRFRKLMNAADFPALGPTGRGVLTISGGMAVFPHDAATPESLYQAADRALMFGAKKGGKNSIVLVGSNHCISESSSD
jgi:GGDEF domain-containing protein